MQVKDLFVFNTACVYVRHLRNAYEYKRSIGSNSWIGIHTRTLSYLLNPEDVTVFRGFSESYLNERDKEGFSGLYKEHIVPMSVLVWESLSLIENGFDDDYVSRALFRNLGTAFITKAEARYLDYDLKLKSTMPIGWRINDGDPLARYSLAGIRLIDSNGQLVESFKHE